MGLDIFFPEEIRDRLKAINAASASTADVTDNPTVQAYYRGFMEALTAVALSFGLSRADIKVEIEEERR